MKEAEKSFKRISAWETGEAFPTYSQLEKMAERFRMPVAVFFFPEPPNLPSIQETFRTLPDTEFQRLPSQIRLLLRKAKSLQLNLDELTGGRNPHERLITRDLAFSPDVRIEVMARTVREYLGTTLEEQMSWADSDDALKKWRSILLDVGVFVFKDAFRHQGFSGFCLSDERFPLIYVNNSFPKTRQIFSLFHELAHLLFDTSGVDSADDSYISELVGNSKQIEIICNRFSAHFLLPDVILNREIEGEEISEAAAERIASKYHISRESVYRRFLDRDLITAQQYETSAQKWARQKGAYENGGDYYRTKLAYLGREYVELALKEYHRNRIDENQLADYLMVKPRNVSNLEEYFIRGSG